MATARIDYEDFIRWLHKPGNLPPSNVRRIANVVLENFGEVLSSVRQHNQRSTLLAGLARQHLNQTQDDLPEIADVAGADLFPWRRLHHLTIGPFRGFRHQEPFDLSNQVILFYGPNGSGKSSFCEALEYALLGTVEEAEAKRMAEANYLSNIHENRFDPPVLTAIDYHGAELQVEANAEAFRFCFIEKNRIDAFSRIAVRPTAQRAELIATLFGMDKFNEFVSHFNESMDSQLVTTTINKSLLEEKRDSLADDHAAVERETASLKLLDAEESDLASRYLKGTNYKELTNIIGSPERPGRIHQLTELLDAVPPQIIGVTKKGLQELHENAVAVQDKLDELSGELFERATEVSFKELYTAVIALQSTEGDHCPACDTPIDGPNQVISNPYEKAAEGLGRLVELAELQAEHEKTQEAVAQTYRIVMTQLEQMQGFAKSNVEKESDIGRYFAHLSEIEDERWRLFRELNTADTEDGAVALKDFLDLAQQIEDQDAASRQAISERDKNISERDRLLEFQLLVQTQVSKRREYLTGVKKAKSRIEKFEEDNADLIQAAATEQREFDGDAPIKAAYDSFLELLKRYRNQLPRALMAGLNDCTMRFYNEINVEDLDADKLASLRLPLTGEERIEICFRGNPQERVDALKVLSEGHIRCLGLAILLAKNSSIGSPLLIFDDAVNAIDHDHRGGIRETIFGRGHFDDVQVVVTCHSNEFIKDIQQRLPRPILNNSKTYLFLHHDGNHHPRVNGNVQSQNYVQRARVAQDELNERGALDASRKAVEMQAEEIWKWLGSHEHGVIKVKLPRIGGRPGLRNLCEALRVKLNSIPAFRHDNKQPIIEALETLLGIPEQSLVWDYLNSGVHEVADRDDFDRDIVESVVVTIEQLEALELRRGR